MSAIERCRTEALGGHVLRCDRCGTDHNAYNSCRNRHCPKCCGNKAERWLADRQADLLPVEAYKVGLPCGLYAPSSDRRYRVPEQSRDLRSAVPGLSGNASDDRRRSQAPRR